MEEKILYNVLKSIGTGKEHATAPDDEYLEALATIGMIKMGWDNTLTDLGESTLNRLRNSIEKW